LLFMLRIIYVTHNLCYAHPGLTLDKVKFKLSGFDRWILL